LFDEPFRNSEYSTRVKLWRHSENNCWGLEDKTVDANRAIISRLGRPWTPCGLFFPTQAGGTCPFMKTAEYVCFVALLVSLLLHIYLSRLYFLPLLPPAILFRNGYFGNVVVLFSGYKPISNCTFSRFS